jgi:hypothetical protein
MSRRGNGRRSAGARHGVVAAMALAAIAIVTLAVPGVRCGTQLPFYAASGAELGCEDMADLVAGQHDMLSRPSLKAAPMPRPAQMEPALAMAVLLGGLSGAPADRFALTLTR